MEASKPTRFTIYSHTHVTTGRRYVGLTKLTMLKRWNQHLQNAKKKAGKGCTHFWNAIRAYGSGAFSHEVLEVITTSLEDANLAEERWIEKLQTRDPSKGFNLAKGGKHTPHPVRNPWDRPEYRAKATVASRKTWSDPARRSAASVARVGVPLSESHKAAVSESMTGKKHDPAWCSRNAERQRKSHARPEVKAKISRASKAAWEKPEFRQAITSSSSSTAKALWQDRAYRTKCMRHTETHKTCKVHGDVLLKDCYVRRRADKTYYECKRCVLDKQKSAYALRTGDHVAHT